MARAADKTKGGPGKRQPREAPSAGGRGWHHQVPHALAPTAFLPTYFPHLRTYPPRLRTYLSACPRRAPSRRTDAPSRFVALSVPSVGYLLPGLAGAATWNSLASAPGPSANGTLRATAHTRLRARDQSLQAVSLVEKTEPVQVRASHYAWGINGVCECKMDVKSTWMDLYMVSNGSCFMVTWTIFQKSPLGGRPNTKPPGDHGTLNVRNCWFVLFYHVWGSSCLGIYWDSI